MDKCENGTELVMSHCSFALSDGRAEKSGFHYIIFKRLFRVCLKFSIVF